MRSLSIEAFPWQLGKAILGLGLLILRPMRFLLAFNSHFCCCGRNAPLPQVLMVGESFTRNFGGNGDFHSETNWEGGECLASGRCGQWNSVLCSPRYLMDVPCLVCQLLQLRPGMPSWASMDLAFPIFIPHSHPCSRIISEPPTWRVQQAMRPGPWEA